LEIHVVANGQTHRVPGQVGAASIKSLMGDRPKRFIPRFSSLQEALLDGLRRTSGTHTQHTDDEPDDDDTRVETPRGMSLEARLREVLGSAVVDDLEQDAMTDMALNNWLHSTGVKHLACARTLAHMVASHLDSMDLLDRITREVEAIG
jgi:hypothetical protein